MKIGFLGGMARDHRRIAAAFPNVEFDFVDPGNRKICRIPKGEVVFLWTKHSNHTWVAILKREKVQLKLVRGGLPNVVATLREFCGERISE